MTQRSSLSAALSTIVLSTLLVVGLPRAVDAYCNFGGCYGPNPSYCPNYCKTWYESEFYWDPYCIFATGGEYCEYKLCWHVDDGYGSPSCPDSSVCQNEEQSYCWL